MSATEEDKLLKMIIEMQASRIEEQKAAMLQLDVKIPRETMANWYPFNPEVSSADLQETA